MPRIRSSIVLGLLALILLGCSAFAGALPVASQQARAADGTGEDTTTSPEEPPLVETPTEPETTPEAETPKTTPPVTTGPVGTPTGSTPVETPKTTPSSGSTATGGDGGGGGSSSGGSSGSGSSGGAPTSTATTTTPSRHTSRVTPTPTHVARGGGGKSAGAGKRDPQATAGGGGGGGGGASAPPRTERSPAPQPTVSPQAIDNGASAVSNAATHVGETFSKALPAAPLKKIGDRLAAHLAGVDRGRGGKRQKQAAEGIGNALGAALISSAVAVDHRPAASGGPIPFFDPPGGKSSAIYLVLIAALLIAVAALLFREARSALGLGGLRKGAPEARGASSPVPLRERGQLAALGLGEAATRWTVRFRRLRANAAAGLRSLF